MKIKIEDDLFDISARLKEIDETYFVVFDTEKCWFEVHSAVQKGNSFCFVVGNKLTYYAIEKAQKTRIIHLKSLIKKIEEENFNFDRKKKENLRNLIDCKMKARIEYADKRNEDVDFLLNEVDWV